MLSLDLFPNQPMISAQRFDLRLLRVSDTGQIAQHSADVRIARMTSRIAHPLPPGASATFVERAMRKTRDEDIWAIDGSKSGRPDLMGIISLKRLEREQSELGYWIAAAFWNTGLASEAVQALVKANPMMNTTIFAAVFQDNLASARVLSKAGFHYLGDAETFSVARDETVPTRTYTIKLTL